jgi:lipoprotein-releasing system permease protein
LNVPFELHIALRYLFARRKQAFISVISLISTLGVTVGVMALVMALALMTGLQQELRNRIVGSTAHLYIWKTGDGIRDYQAEAARIAGMPHVLGAAPAILGKALISSPRGEAFITIKGIDPALERQVTQVADAVKHGRLDALAAPTDVGLDGIAIGEELATNLGAYVGDTVTVVTPHGTLSPMGLLPRPRRLRVAAIFSVGLFEFDAAYGFVSLDVARRLLDKTGVDFIQLRVDDVYAAPRIADDLAARLGDAYLTQDWSDMNRSLFSALWLEKLAISITIGLIVMVAALNIIASLILLVMEKHRDIAILKTMGATSQSIMRVFMLQGLIIGVVGTTVGASVGYALGHVLDRYQVIRIPTDVYQISYVRFITQPLDLVIVIASAVLICFLATLYPSRQAARLDPAQALRYE